MRNHIVGNTNEKMGILAEVVEYYEGWYPWVDIHYDHGNDMRKKDGGRAKGNSSLLS